LGSGAWNESLSLQSEERGLVRVGGWHGTLCGRVVRGVHGAVSWGLRGLHFLCRGPSRHCILLAEAFKMGIGRSTLIVLERVGEMETRENSVGLLGLNSWLGI
jgi:hypothetical protein